MDKNLKLILQIIAVLLLLASIGSFIYGIAVLIQYFQLKNELSHNPVEKILKKTILNNMKTTFLATIVIGLIGMSISSVALNILFLHIVNILLFISSIVMIILGILSLTTGIFYNGDSDYSTYSKCINAPSRWDVPNPKCGRNTKTIGGLLIGFGLPLAIIFGVLFKKYTFKYLKKFIILLNI